MLTTKEALGKLLDQLDNCSQNQAYVHLEVADFRSWNSVEVTDSEIDMVLASEAHWRGGLTCRFWVPTSISLAKKSFLTFQDDKQC